MSVPLGVLGLDFWLPKQSISLINRKRESQQNLDFEGEQAHQAKSLHIMDLRDAEEFVWLRFYYHTSSSGVYLSHGNYDTFPRPKYKVTETERQRQQTTNSRAVDGCFYLAPEGCTSCAV